MENIKITPFVDDGEKMRDFFDLTKEEAGDMTRFTMSTEPTVASGETA